MKSRYKGYEDFEIINNKTEYLISDLNPGSIIKIIKVNNSYGNHYNDIKEKLFLTILVSEGAFMVDIEKGELWYNEKAMKEDIDYVMIKQR